MLMDAPFKVMPHNVEAEQSVLGSMIIDKTSIAQALEVLSREDFYKESHQTLFDTILDLYQKDVAVDLVTITENLQAKEKLESAGGITYISQICSSVISTANLQSYIKIVKEKSVLRKLIKASSKIIEESYNKQDDVVSVVDSADRKSVV